MDELYQGWLIYEVSDRDYLLGGDDNIKLEIQKRPFADEIRYPYNQLELKNWTNCCVPTACMWALSDLMNREFTISERQEVVDSAVQQGILDLHAGMRFYQWIDLVRKWWNSKNPDNQVISFRLTYGSDAYFEAMNRGHSLVCGYRGNSEYNADSSDGILEWKDFRPSTYGHCIRAYRHEGLVKVIDNYEGRKIMNEYGVLYPNDLVVNGVYYNEFYLFLQKNYMTPEQLSAFEAQKNGIWNGQRPNDPATRMEVAIMLDRLYDKLKSNG